MRHQSSFDARSGGPRRVGRLVVVVLVAATGVVVWARGQARAADASDSEGKPASAEKLNLDVVNKALAKAKEGQQEMLKLPVRIVGADGKPVAKAKVTPWALRSSQGHGWWSKDDKEAGVGPQEAVTDANGEAVVLYPKYRYLQELIKTIGVSVNVDHPDFAYVRAEHIDVPLETKGPYEVKLKPAVRLEVRPLVDGKPAPLDNLFAVWSDGRSWLPGAAPEKTAEGTLRFPGMAPGKNSLLLVKMEGERAAYFSKIVDFELKEDEPQQLDVALEPSVRIRGKVSENVPRPIRQGFIKTWSLELPPDENGSDRVTWFSWSPIAADGTFTIDGWPAGERVEIIALCDGFVAESGKAPDVVKNPRDPATDPFDRPQVFAPNDREELTIEMTPMAQCVVTAIDEGGTPVAGVKVGASPNVGWWNGGSQIYCWPLVRGERMLLTRDYYSAKDKEYSPPFEGETDAKGKLTLALPGGRQDLYAGGDVYELPVFLGRREVRVNLASGETSDVTMHLQASGTEKLGDWDKLAGVVFGCSTREGRRICALPEVRKKMDEFTKRFQEGQSQRDPKLLAEAYAFVADAFAGVGDAEEAAKWRKKAEVEAEKAQRAGEKSGQK